MCVDLFTGKFASFVCGRLFYDRYLLYKCNHVYQCSDSRLHNMYYAGHVAINLRTLCYSCFFLSLPFTTVRSSVWSIVFMTYYLTIRLSARFRHDLPRPLWQHFRLVDCDRPLKATTLLALSRLRVVHRNIPQDSVGDITRNTSFLAVFAHN